jgi:hypothetical protein
MGLLILLLVAIGIIAWVIAYFIWIVRAIRKRRFRLLAGLILAPIMLYFCITAGTYIYGQHQFRKYLNNLFSVPTELAHPIFMYDSPRAFNGDGYTLYVYPLPQAVSNRFAKADKDLLEYFPIRPEYRKHWDTVFWQETPFRADYKIYLEFALSHYERDDRNKLKKHFDDIRVALKMSGNYYSFFHYDLIDHPEDIDFFLIDMVGHRLYIINNNT